MTHLEYLIVQAKKDSDWVIQAESVLKIERELKDLDKPHSVRVIGNLIDKSKSWVSISLLLAREMKEDQHLRSLSRSVAYKRVMNKI